MTTKEAIAILRNTPADHVSRASLKLVEIYLRSVQKREREVFKRLSLVCVNCQTTIMGSCEITTNKCTTLRNCPLLKEIK